MNDDFVPPALEELAALLPAYDFEILIARGGMGAVYRAKQKSLGRDVAVKVLPRELGRNPKYRESFETEARAMARLNHPNLIGVYDSGTVDEMLYIVMEYVPGKSLYHSSYGKQVDPEQVVDLIQGICAGLGHAHENGIIHRDIKPANVLLTPKAEPKIGDFGLARPADAVGSGLVMGTPGYTAPELLTNPQAADQRSDLYAVGVLLYELLTGQRQPEQSPPPPSQLCGCGQGMDDIWRKTTHSVPSMRYQTAEQLSEALGKWLQTFRRTKTAPLRAAQTKAQPTAAVPAVKGVIPVPGKAAPAAAATPAEQADAVKQIQIEMHSNWGLIRNLFIIAFLIIAVAVVWKMTERQRFAAEDNLTKEESMSFERRTREEAEARERVAEEQRRQEEIRQRQAARDKENQGETSGETAGQEKQKEESAVEILERLRFDLSQGKRDILPPNTVRRGDSAFFPIGTPLTWPEAASFAERYGGHLPTPDNAEDLAWLEKLAPGEESIWIGGGKSGRSAWTMLDGKLWGVDPAPRGTGLYVSVGRLGMRTFDGKTKLPFVIQWRLDGSNPATLANTLQVARESLGDANPVYPPGTVAYDSRHFLYVARPVAWQEAADLAELAGGHLAAVSNPTEAGHLAEYINSQEVENGVWLGARSSSVGWNWASGESWGRTYWADGKEPAGPDLGLLVEPGKGWTGRDAKNTASGFLIEWSEDARKPAGASTAAIPADVAGDSLGAKAKELAQAAERKRLNNFAANAKAFSWDLDVWMRGLSQNERTTWQPHVAALKSLVRQHRVPATLPEDSKIELHPQMSRIADRAAEKQAAVNSEFLAEITRIRQAYQTRLRTEIQKAENDGQIERGRTLRKEFQNAADNESWLAGFGIRAVAELPESEL